jgi:hypothetical protein
VDTHRRFGNPIAAAETPGATSADSLGAVVPLTPVARRQNSQPKGRDPKGEPHKPVEIPVPKRDEFDRLLAKAEKPKKR